MNNSFKINGLVTMLVCW